jgi:hypothetical protein
LLPIAIPLGIIAFLSGIGVAARGGSRGTAQDSPVKGVVFVRWLRFTRIMAKSPLSHDAPNGRMGAFGLHPRRLADVGLVQAPHKVTVGDDVGVWTAAWRPPLSKELFLKSPPIQYEAFKRSVVDMVPKVSGLVGTDVGGVKCTLSGLLGVGHQAGVAGVDGWVKDSKVREKFGKTTATFHLTNGIF